MLPQVSQAHSIGQGVLHQVPRGLREQHLAPVPHTHQACREMHIQAHVAVRRRLRLPGVQPHADAHRSAFGPGMRGKGTLGGHGSRDGIGGTRKGEEAGVSLGIDFVPVRLLESRAQHLPVLSQHTAILLPYVLQQERRPLDIGEEQRDRSCRYIKHARLPPTRKPKKPSGTETASHKDELDHLSALYLVIERAVIQLWNRLAYFLILIITNRSLNSMTF